MKTHVAIGFFSLVLAFVPMQLVSAADLSRDQTVSLVTHMLKAWETNDVAAFSDAFSKGAIFAYPGDRLSKSELVDMFKEYQTQKKDIKIYVGLFLVQGNRFSGQYQFAATDRKSGKRQAVGTAITGIVKDGKLVVYKEYWDQHILNWQEEGKIPLDEAKVYPAPASITMGPERIN
jgi:ketosteroid isomerase-like protein